MSISSLADSRDARESREAAFIRSMRAEHAAGAHVSWAGGPDANCPFCNERAAVLELFCPTCNAYPFEPCTSKYLHPARVRLYHDWIVADTRTKRLARLYEPPTVRVLVMNRIGAR
jgi:hypothetical protein